MHWVRVKRFLSEREVLIGLVIFGLFAMVADIFGDFQQGLLGSVIVRVGAMVFLVLLLFFDYWVKQRKQVIPVPMVFTEETDRTETRHFFKRFVQVTRLERATKVIETLSSVQQDDLIIRLNRTNPRQSIKSNDWETAWRELLREWEREVDKQLSIGFKGDAYCYHVLPHLVLPLSFALGASVGLRRSVVVYHMQERQFFKVLDLSYPRCLFEVSTLSVPPPEVLSTQSNSHKLILHMVISDRHPIKFDNHPEYANADNVGILYKITLPQEDWLPYVQQLVRLTSPYFGKYKQIELCLLCPSAVVFALGMAFSRNPQLTVCSWINNQYVPVFSLQRIEERLPFD